ncbi:MAG: hypothetical protein MI754_03965 [Chromatiales bacterium]|nr:hypothetical protein [Chromatiales bacterium]
MSSTTPSVGAWYKTTEGELLEVVAWDPEEAVIEVQFFDGTVEEYDLDSWDLLEPQPADPPEDWSGSLDLMREDYGVDREHPAGDTHTNPLDDIDITNQ